MTRKKNIGYAARWRYSVEMTPDDADERPGFMFLYDEPMDDIEFDHEPNYKEIAKAISAQGYKTVAKDVFWNDADEMLAFKGETADGKFFFSVDPHGSNPKLSQADYERLWPRLKNSMRKAFWRPEPPHGPEAIDLESEKLSMKGLEETPFVVAEHGRGWAPCSIIISKVFRRKRDGEFVYSSHDEENSILSSTDDIYQIAEEQGWLGPPWYTDDQIDEMLERRGDRGYYRGLTDQEKEDAEDFFDNREREAFDDPGYF